MEKTSSRFGALVPGLAVLGVFETASLALSVKGYDVAGFTWLVAALVAAFSLSGSV
ncbi:hypothetical protein ACQPYA_14845 [Micromonospora sp. CA-263727]|uniref:hypothetical protein n=1 Tax=Micromonospora sp. CA-263727 TaxID=3239967 RepID=UPI003D920961